MDKESYAKKPSYDSLTEEEKGKGILFNSDMGFCHRHPGKERELNLDTDHVIIDFNDWFVLRWLCLDIKCFMCGTYPKVDFNFKSNFDNKKPGNSMNWVCNDCKRKIEEMKKEWRK